MTCKMCNEGLTLVDGVHYENGISVNFCSNSENTKQIARYIVCFNAGKGSVPVVVVGGMLVELCDFLESSNQVVAYSVSNVNNPKKDLYPKDLGLVGIYGKWI